MPSTVLAVLLAVVVTLGVSGGVHLARAQGRRLRLTGAAVALWVCVAAPSLLQVPFPGLLEDLRRDPARIRAGEAWRLLTSAVVQDGGATGTTFNLVALALTVLVAGSVWRGGRLWSLFLTCHLATTVLVLLTFATTGAGNSVATIGLGTAMVATLALRQPRAPRRSVAAVGLAAVAAGIGGVLLLAQDIHGIAVCVGLVVGMASSRAWSSGRSSADAA